MGVQEFSSPDALIDRTQGLFIDNLWRPSASGRCLDVVEPATGGVFAQVAAGDARDVDAAVRAARNALEGEWGRLCAADRGRLLTRLAGICERHSRERAALESRDTGKPQVQARDDMTVLVRYLEFYGGAADKIHGEAIPLPGDQLALVERVRHGVTGHIIPWNYPAQMFGRTLAPALVMGNATVMKPAENACLTVLRLAELSREAGFPPGAINIVPGRGESAGAALSANPGVDFLSFTGSPDVGTLVQIAAARKHRGCILELGGKSPQIVFADADLDAATSAIVSSIVQNAGQTCSAGSRVLVEGCIRNDFSERLSEAFRSLRAGPPEVSPDLGPVINLTQKRRVERFCSMAEEVGIPLLGEGAIDRRAAPGGYFVTPRIYGPAPRDHPIAREEVFGPVLALLEFSDENDAVRLANGTDYGLVAGVWARDAAKAVRVARRIEAGQVFVNGYGSGGDVELPFGGVRKSGHGREKGMAALYEMSSSRSLVINYGGASAPQPTSPDRLCC